MKRGGFYWVDGKPYPSVTSVIDLLDKPALRYWYGQMVYRAYTANPALSEKEALAAPYLESNGAKERGKLIHSLVEAWKTTRKEVDFIPSEYKGYAEAWYNFCERVKLEPIAHEKVVISKKYTYAGTLDLYAVLNGKRILVDIKTSKKGNIYDGVHLQLAAYKQAMIELGATVDNTFALALAENGTWTFQETKESIKPFLGLLEVFKWKNQDYLFKLKEAK